MTPLERAREWVALGQPVLVAKRNPNWTPESRDKEFFFPRNWQSAEADSVGLESWEEGDALIAPCGHLFDVIDIDTKNGPEITRESVPGEIETFGEHRTPSGGYHLFVHPMGYSKGPLHIAGHHIGDYIGSTDTGAGRGFVFLPGTGRAKYDGGGYDVIREVDLDKLVDSFPDDLLDTILVSNGRSRRGEGGRSPVSVQVMAEFRSTMTGVHPSCEYGRSAINNILGEAPSVGQRHNWYVKAMLRVVELAKAGCCGLADVSMLNDKLREVMGRDMDENPDEVFRYALANTVPVTHCRVHKSGEVLLDPSDPAYEVERSPFGYLDWPESWASLDAEAEPDLVHGIIPAGCMVSLYAKAGVGKSLLLLEWAVELARGGTIFEMDVPPTTVLYYDKENAPDEVMRRLESMGYGPETNLDNLLYSSYSSLPPLDTEEGAKKFVAEVSRSNAKLVIIDTLSKVVAGEENSADTYSTFNRLTSVPLRRLGVTMIRLDHAGKDAERGARGSSAKQADLDIEYLLRVTREPTMEDSATRLELEPTKVRLGGVSAAKRFLFRKTDPTRHELEMTPTEFRRYSDAVDFAKSLDDHGIPMMSRRKTMQMCKELDVHAPATSVVGEALKIRKREAALAKASNGG